MQGKIYRKDHPKTKLLRGNITIESEYQQIDAHKAAHRSKKNSQNPMFKRMQGKIRTKEHP